VPQIHHSAIHVTSVDESLRFWRDGLGFEVLMDERFDGDWPTLFGGRSRQLRAVFLGDPKAPGSGIVELVDLGVEDAQGEPDGPATGPSDGPAQGFLLLSVLAPVETTLARLAELGLGGEPRLITASGVAMAVVTDPDGVLVELVDTAAAANLDALTDRAGVPADRS
jgi:glyoxylase I family protein